MITLEQNYRSTGSILRAANAVIGHNPKLFEKKLWSELGDGEPVRVVECDDEEHEAERAVARIQSHRARNGLAPGAGRDFADPVSRQPPGARVRAGAAQGADPVQGLGRAELLRPRRDQDLCAWLRLIVNNDDDPAFLRAVTTPKRGIGHQTLASLGAFAGRWKVEPVRGAVRRDRWPTRCRARAVGGLHEFGRYVNDLRVPRAPHDRRRGREGACCSTG